MLDSGALRSDETRIARPNAFRTGAQSGAPFTDSDSGALRSDETRIDATRAQSGAPFTDLDSGALRSDETRIDATRAQSGAPFTDLETRQLSTSGRKIVVDGANVARSMKSEIFCCQALRIAYHCLKTQGFEVKIFLPSAYLEDPGVKTKECDNFPQGTCRYGKYCFFAHGRKELGEPIRKDPRKVPDDIKILRALKEAGIIFCTPPGAYDDSFMIKYARMCDVCIVTNDLLRDYIEKQRDVNEADEWVKTHCVRYMFVNEVFVPLT